MPLVADRVAETTTTTGTGTVTLAGAKTGYQAFTTAFSTGAKVYYCITDNTNWEVGVGTFTTVGTTLSRDSIFASSNAGAAVNWGAGSKDVFCTAPMQSVVGAPRLQAKTGAYTVVASDNGSIINCTSNTFTVSLTAAATLGSGFTCWVWNTSGTSTHAITIAASGVETIDGVSTLILRRGEGAQIVCDGTNWQTGDKKTMRGYAENILATTTRTQAAGDNSIALGAASSSSGQYSTALGYFCTAAAQYSTAIGSSSNGQAAYALTGAGSIAIGAGRASGVDSFAAAIRDVNYGASSDSAVAIGFRAQATNSYSYACGNNAVSSGINSIAVGANASATNTSSLAIGRQPTATGIGSLAVGYITTASSSYSSAIGANSSTQGSQAVTGSGAMALGGSYASGTDSFAAAIANNTSSYGATGANSVAIGSLSKATGADAVSIGDTNTASAQSAVVIGGVSTASQSYAVALGYQANSAIIGKYTYASGQFAALGDAQNGAFVLRCATTSAAATVLTTDNTTAGANDQVILPNNSAYAFTGTVVARQQAAGGTQSAAWNIEGLIRREANAASTTLVASTVTAISNVPGWTLALSADTTNGGLAITATGAAATNIRWVATVQTSEVTYA